MVNKLTATQGYGTSKVGVIEIPTATLAVGATPPAAVTRAPFSGYGYTVGDDSYFQFPLPADYELQTGASLPDFSVYARWCCNENYAAANGEVRFQVSWVVSNQNGEALLSGRGGQDHSGDINIPATALQIQETRIADITTDYILAGDTIGCTLSRVAAEAGTAPTAEPEILKLWVVYPSIWVWDILYVGQ